ncbi:MAG: hypothetical protein WEB62_05750, partial [Bacteroidota bacterium]
KFGLEKPAFRVLVNTQAALGAVGYTNELLPSMTLGPGTFGGSIISENVSAKHLINIKRLAFETRPINPPEKFVLKTAPVPQKTELPAATIHHVIPAQQSWIEEIERRIRLKASNVVEPAPVVTKKEPAEASLPTPATKAGVIRAVQFGTNLNEADVERIMKEFQAKLK